jgi:hypothetical protein
MPNSSPPRPRDHWPLLLGAMHAAHTLCFASVYPDVVYDPDLVAYFVYFRNWFTGVTSLHDAPYFTVPKPLLVFLLGPLDSAHATFVVSTVCAGLFGTLVYLICRKVFDRTTGILCSALLLLDVDRMTLTARGSADFYLALLLYASIYAALVRRYAASGIAIALAALVKPVALPCAVHLLAVEGEDRRRAWAGAAIALVALPLVLLSNQVLLGSPFGTQRFFSGFASMSDAAQIPTGDLLRFVLWVEFAKTIFVATVPFGVLGLVGWLAGDKRRLTNPFFLTPLALLAGYVALSITTPFIPFFRFFWSVQVWFGCFIVFGMVQTCRRLVPEPRTLRVAATAACLYFLADDQIHRHVYYQSHFAGPFEEAMKFVSTTDPLLANDRRPGETILTPVAFLPYLLWTLDDVRKDPSLLRMVEQQDQQEYERFVAPDWVLYVPAAILRDETRNRVYALLESGLYVPYFHGGGNVGALYVRRDHFDRLARADVR